MTDISKSPDRIAGMFDAIAGRYDFLNHLLSAGIDRRWRTRAIRSLALTGTRARARPVHRHGGPGDRRAYGARPARRASSASTSPAPCCASARAKLRERRLDDRSRARARRRDAHSRRRSHRSTP